MKFIKDNWVGLSSLLLIFIFAGIGIKACLIAEEVRRPIVVINGNTVRDSLISVFGMDSSRAETMGREIEFASKRFKTEWQKVVAVIRVESNFNPFAIGKHGEVGLMQMMPSTASDEAKRLNLLAEPYYLYNEHYSITLGTFYIAKMEMTFGWNFERAIRAYQAGEQGYYNGLSDDEHWQKVSTWYNRLK